MKLFFLLLILLAGGFLFWQYSDLLDTPQEKTTDITSYTVVKGDTLSSIARRHHTSVQSIKQRNKLSSDTITIGQTLYLKADEQPSPSNTSPAPRKDNNTPQPTRAQPIAKKDLPKSTVMETSKIAIDIDSKNQVYLKNSTGKFVPAGTIIYGSDADANGIEIKTITFRDLKGTETTLPAKSADPETLIRKALKK